MIVKLSEEYSLGSKKYKEINLDLEGMSGLTLIEAEREYYTNSMIKELEYGWYLTVASESSGIKYGDFLKLNARDCVKIVNAVRGFLQSTDSEEIEKAEVVETLGSIE